MRRRLTWDCLPWRGDGRYLDVGWGSGGSLGTAKALGWQVAGIEVDAAAADKARRFTDSIHVGGVLGTPFAAGASDVVSAFQSWSTCPIRWPSSGAC